MHVADNEENPYAFGHDRTVLLNRSTITLNITRTWYDDNMSRLAMAMSNRSLVVSEPLQEHCTDYQPNVHYISVSPDQIPSSILHYLEHETERQEFVERAYELMVNRVTFRRSIERIMTALYEAEKSGSVRHRS